MEISAIYIISQVVTVLFYILLACTYFLKDKRRIIIFSTISLILNMVAFILLGAWSGVAMCAVALIRNIVIQKYPKVGDKPWFLLVIFVLIALLTIPTYDGFWSLMSVFATCLYSYSIWQKKPFVYKLCGIPIGVLWIIYNIYIFSVFGIALESILTISAVIGIINSLRKKPNQTEKEKTLPK